MIWGERRYPSYVIMPLVCSVYLAAVGCVAMPRVADDGRILGGHPKVAALVRYVGREAHSELVRGNKMAQDFFISLGVPSQLTSYQVIHLPIDTGAGGYCRLHICTSADTLDHAVRAVLWSVDSSNKSRPVVVMKLIEWDGNNESWEIIQSESQVASGR